jgi:hypothetical protein
MKKQLEKLEENFMLNFHKEIEEYFDSKPK